MQPHKILYTYLEERDVSYEVNKEYDTADIFVGAAVTLAVSTLRGRQMLIQLI